ncbi:MAG: FAD-binding protein, partial [Acaryochloridaceae cyanobacterium CSU_5_19]|nr:FAD-binding protein [Acaryochloridaceae cyanobacterium CSU_5_19]
RCEGKGPSLLDVKGQRFMFDYHRDGELAPRDVVSRSIFKHLQTNLDTSEGPSPDQVWLDLTPIPADHLRCRFPKIIQVCHSWGIDVFTQPIPVAPAAHYWMGGIATNLQSQTSLPGLYAVGEVASTGVHGANRLASNSLLECLVFAAQFATLKVPAEQAIPISSQVMVEKVCSRDSISLEQLEQQEQRLLVVRSQLPELLWAAAGIIRQGSQLEAAIHQVQEWRQEFAQLPISRLLKDLPPGQPLTLTLPEADRHLRTWAETRNLLDIGYLILKTALFRTESRGGHYRMDYPQTSSDWQMHSRVEAETWQRTPLSNP